MHLWLQRKLIKTRNVKGSHKTQPTVWPGPHACAQPITRAVATMDTCLGLVSPHQHGIAVGLRGRLESPVHAPFTAEAGGKHPFKQQPHSKHVVAVVGDTKSSAMRVGVDHLERCTCDFKKNFWRHKTQPTVWPGLHACLKCIKMILSWDRVIFSKM